MRWLLLALGALACGPAVDGAQLDPASCKGCHPEHYRQWSGSMHAYAAEDPVFLAMNARGQRETNGALGDFCVKCHAPMAVRTGATKDGLNLAAVPAHLKGVSCAFCHQIDAVEGEHSAAVRTRFDGVMRAGIADPIDNEAHASAYSPIHDRGRIESAGLCGACHDIVTPRGVHLERTYLEWQRSLFAKPTPTEQLTCGECHMPGRRGVAAEVEGVPLRRVHDHSMAGVDLALTPFPEAESQRALVRRELDSAVRAELCVVRHAGGATLAVTLENVGAGHSFPSGAAQDRRVWVEIVAYRGRQVVFESGRVPDGQSPRAIVEPTRWELGDRLFDGDREVHMFWEASRFESALLPAMGARTPDQPGWVQTHVRRDFVVPAVPDRVTLRVRVQPIGLDVLDDLVASGDLDPSVREAMPTFTIGPTELEWSARTGLLPCVP